MVGSSPERKMDEGIELAILASRKSTSDIIRGDGRIIDGMKPNCFDGVELRYFSCRYRARLTRRALLLGIS
jgi:hypothetical protein